MGWFFVAFLLGFAFSNLSEASHGKKLPSAVVVGTVYCDTCFQQSLSKSSHFISGASVAVECKDEKSSLSFREEVKTDDHGEFKVHLPFSVSKHVKKIKRCSVKLLTSSEPYCAGASMATSSSLHLQSRKKETHIFSAGFFSFKPQNQPNLCNQKPRVQDSRKFNAGKNSLPTFSSAVNPAFPPPLQVPDLPGPLPLLPNLPPLPQLPRLPSLPGLPFVPPIPGKSRETKTTESSKNKQFSDQKVNHPEGIFPTPPLFPPNPFQPPPLIPNPFQPPPLIPNPFQPPPSPLIPNPFQPPPSPLIPNPFQPPPSPSPLFPFPPIPGITPTPSPPPPPAFPFPLPPFLFPPSPPPRIPGIPPTSSSSSSQKASP